MIHFQFSSEVFIFFYTHLHIYRYFVFNPFGYGEHTNTTHITDNTKHPTLTQTQNITIFSPYYLHIKQSPNIANSKSLVSLTRKSKQPTQVYAHGLPHTFTFDKRTYSFTQHTSVKTASLMLLTHGGSQSESLYSRSSSSSSSSSLPFSNSPIISCR